MSKLNFDFYNSTCGRIRSIRLESAIRDYLCKKSMAYPNLPLIEALRSTATKLREGSFYAWGHHGACNCGSLLQVITSMTKEEILTYAHTGTGEWTEIAEDYCMVTGAPAYLMISKLEALGLTSIDIHNLEYLDDKKILSHLPGGFRWLKRNVREDVIIYFETFANMLEMELPINSFRKNRQTTDVKSALSLQEANEGVFA